MPDERLIPCPFCGGEEFDIETENEVGDPPEYFIVCNIHKKGCGASSGYRDTEKEAIKAWNTRANVSIGMSREEAKANISHCLEYLCRADGWKIIDEIYDSIEPKNVVAEFEVNSNGDVFENEQILCDITIEDVQNGEYIVTIQKKQDE